MEDSSLYVTEKQFYDLWSVSSLAFSERYPQFTEKGAVILGVSKDSVASHKRFEEKIRTGIYAISDPERKVIEAYDVWKEKKKLWKSIYGCSKNYISY